MSVHDHQRSAERSLHAGRRPAHSEDPAGDRPEGWSELAQPRRDVEVAHLAAGEPAHAQPELSVKRATVKAPAYDGGSFALDPAHASASDVRRRESGSIIPKRGTCPGGVRHRARWRITPQGANEDRLLTGAG